MSTAEEKPVSGPNVRRLLTQPLPPGWSLRLGRGYAENRIELEELVTLKRSADTYKTIRASFKICGSTRPYRARTNAEIAAQVDAWLVRRSQDLEAAEADRRAQAAREAEQAARRMALLAEMGVAEAFQVPLFPGLRLDFYPAVDGTGWRVVGVQDEGAAFTSADLRALLARVRR